MSSYSRLEKLNNLQRSLFETGSFEEKLKKITSGVVEIFKADFSRIWINQPGDLCNSGCIHAKVKEGPHVCRFRDQCLHLFASSGRYTHIDGPHCRMPFGLYKLGRVAAGEAPKFLTNNVTQDPQIMDHQWAKELDLVSFAGYKLQNTTGKAIGVLALFSKQAITPEQDVLLEGLAGTTAQVIQSGKVQEALQKSQSHFRTLIETAPSVILFLSPKGDILEFNSEAERVYGCKKEEALGQNYFEMFTPDEVRKRFVENFKEVLSGKSTRGFENLIKGADGKALFFSWDIDRILDGKGNLTGAVAIGQNITDLKIEIITRKKINEELDRKTKLIELLQEIAITSNEASTAEEAIKICLDKVCFHTGWPVGHVYFSDSAGKLIPSKIWHIATPQLHKKFQKITEVTTFDKDIGLPGRVLSGGKPEWIPDVTRDPNFPRAKLAKDIGVKAGFAFPVLEGKKVVAVLEFFAKEAKEPDEFLLEAISGLATQLGRVTERKRAEEEKERLQSSLQQVQKMESIGTLAGGIAHDFNNILTSIIGYAELNLGKFPLGSKTYADLKQILDSGFRARDLVKQILTFSRQGKHTVSTISLAPILREALKFMRSSLPTNIEIRQNLDDHSGTILGDITQIHQIIMNLCINAEHAMRKKGGVLEVNLKSVYLDSRFCATHFRLKEGDYLKLTVSDTGHGMSKEIMERIFDPFFTTKGVGEGSGMGLSTVHGIVLTHGGDIIVGSELGKGTNIEIYLPKSEEIEIEEKTKFLALTIPRGNEQILFVDDEESVAKFGQDMLGSLGYGVLSKTNSLEALEIFKKDPQKFDLVITDQTMPNMTGDVLAKELMKIRSEIPVILCTGFSHTITAKEAITIGIREFIMKPYINRDIAQVVRKVLDHDKKNE